MSQPTQEPDPFDTLLTLEDTLYTTAYTLGASDGSHAGRIEGRIFGLEKGFEKFSSLGKLHGRSVTWASRLQLPNPTSQNPTCTSIHAPQTAPEEIGRLQVEKEPEPEMIDGTKRLSKLQKNHRLNNNITLLHALTDPATFDTANTEEAVADFDDRVKRAGAKVKVIERMVGETEREDDGDEVEGKGKGRGKGKGPVRVSGEKKGNGHVNKGDDSMEDFVGGKGVRG